jgi:hypothetical protein
MCILLFSLFTIQYVKKKIVKKILFTDVKDIIA